MGKISGAVGTYANVDPQVEAIACQKLGLEPDCASTQVISRDRHADYVQQLALVTASNRTFCRRNSQSSAYRCSRSRRIFLEEAKGFFGYAPQTQPHSFGKIDGYGADRAR